MRITKLEITNFQGLRHAALDVSAPVLLVAGHNGAGKSSLLDAISHAFTGKPGRVAQKQHIGQLITEGARKGEARVEWLDDAGEMQACGVALPSGKGSPLADSPFLPFVLDASRITALRETAALADRRRNKLATDEKAQDEWSEKVMAAEVAASGEPAHQPLTCPHCQGAVDLQAGTLVVHQPPEQIADAEAARRLPEYREYLASAQRAVANSQRDLDECLAAAEQIKALEAESVEAPSAEAIANGEQAINELRQARDRQQAKVQSLQEAFNAAAQRQDVIKQAAGFHAEVCAWSALADALSPTGIPAEILADAIGPVNELLQRLSGTAGWSPVQISADIDVTFGGRLYGLLSESERWRCDATIALAIATISGLRLALLDRFDVLDIPARTQQAMKLFQSLAAGGEIDTLIVAGTLKEPMAKTPTWLQAVWIDAGQLTDQQHQAAA